MYNLSDKKVRKEKIYFSQFSKELEFDVEIFCPHCGIATNSVKKVELCNIDKSINIQPVIFLYEAQCCKKYYLSVYLIDLKTHETKIIFTYPNVRPRVFIPKLHEVSPNFINLFNQSTMAERNGHIELACCGYRNSIEHLLKDFLIKVRNQDFNSISKMSLFEIISYFENKEISISSDVIRIFGNDRTHYLSKYDFEMSTFHLYLEWLIQAIEKEILLVFPPVRR